MANQGTARTIQSAPTREIGPEIGRRIREARTAKGMSLAQVGGADLTRSFLSLVERGKSRISLRALEIVAERLDLPMSYLLGEVPAWSDVHLELALDQVEIALSQNRADDALGALDGLTGARAEHCRITLLRGRAMIALQRYDEATEVLRDALSACGGTDDKELLAQLLYHLGSALYALSAYDEALLYFRRALDSLGGEPEDALLLGKITVYIGHVLYVRGDIDGAISHYRRANRLFRPLGELGALGSLYAGLSRAYNRKNDPRAALRYSKRSVAAFQAQQSVGYAARELNNVAVRYQELGDLAQAEQNARESAAAAHQIGDVAVEALARSTLASILLATGDLDSAQAEAESAVSLAKEDTDLGRIDGWSVLARIAEQRGDPDRADELYRDILDALRPTGQNIRYADTALAYSMVLRQRGDVERALDVAIEAAQARSPRSA